MPAEAPRLVLHVPPCNPCRACNGDGSEWARRKDGSRDRRHTSPLGPCGWCGGSKEAPTVDFDPEAGAFYVTFRKGEHARTVEVSTDLLIDIDAAGQTLGVECLVVRWSSDDEVMAHV